MPPYGFSTAYPIPSQGIWHPKSQSPDAKAAKSDDFIITDNVSKITAYSKMSLQGS